MRPKSQAALAIPEKVREKEKGKITGKPFPIPPAENKNRLANVIRLSPRQQTLRVSIFCGGRGSATVIREFLRRKNISLSLLVNAYDDGLSTGAIRRHIPGMLGPSDFRKNLSHLLEFYSSGRYALAELFEHRLKADLSAKEREIFVLFSSDKLSLKDFPLPQIKQVMSRIDPEALSSVKKYLKSFFEHEVASGKDFNFADCAVGNLIFAGAYLISGKRFNHTIIELSKAFKTRAGLINVSDGEDRVLVALKQNGEVLAHEADIVGKQNPSRIVGLYLIPNGLTPENLKSLAREDLKGKKKILSGLEKTVHVSDAAVNEIKASNIIVYGSGTQHSSLLPSYKTEGIGEAIRSSSAAVKLMLVNIEEDNDIVGMTGSDLVDRTLHYLGDPDNERGSLTHIFLNTLPGKSEKNIAPGKLEGKSIYKNAHVVAKDFLHPVFSYAHCGHKTVDTVLDVFERRATERNRNLTVYVDLERRSTAISHLVEEFLDIDWKKKFGEVRLVLNHPFKYEGALPKHLKIESVSEAGIFSELRFFRHWLQHENSHYLVTFVGDGTYNLTDIFRSYQMLDEKHCGAVFGSRSQSKRQLINSIRAVYGESRFFYLLGSIASAAFSLAFWLRFGLLFSDPLTGFRMYNRVTLHKLLESPSLSKKWLTSSSITAMLIRNSVEVAEIPVQYENLKGFTDVRRRIRRTLGNLIGLFF